MLKDGNKMNKMQQMVKDFHEKFGLAVNYKPTVPEMQTRMLRLRLIMEEITELAMAFDIEIQNVNSFGFDASVSPYSRDMSSIVEATDAIGDLLYVVIGTAVSMGIDIDKVFEEIHRSNMSKVWPDGRVVKNEFGKVIKPTSYSPVDFTKALQTTLKYEE